MQTSNEQRKVCTRIFVFGWAMLRSPGPGQLKTTPVTRGVRESSTAEAVESDNTKVDWWEDAQCE